jgi:hypothetical protein
MTREPSQARKRIPLVPTLAGAILGIAAGIAIPQLLRARSSFEKGRTVSPAQIRAAGAAVEKFGVLKGRRPKNLEELVQAEMVGANEFFDAERGGIPEIRTVTGRFTENPDVVYFPALRQGDPNDLVLLCTMLLRRRGDLYQVIFNDGRYAELPAREFIQALNRTYSYISGRIWPPREPASAPVSASP